MVNKIIPHGFSQHHIFFVGASNDYTQGYGVIWKSPLGEFEFYKRTEKVLEYDQEYAFLGLELFMLFLQDIIAYGSDVPAGTFDIQLYLYFPSHPHLPNYKKREIEELVNVDARLAGIDATVSFMHALKFSYKGLSDALTKLKLKNDFYPKLQLFSSSYSTLFDRTLWLHLLENRLTDSIEFYQIVSASNKGIEGPIKIKKYFDDDLNLMSTLKEYQSASQNKKALSEQIMDWQLRVIVGLNITNCLVLIQARLTEGLVNNFSEYVAIKKSMPVFLFDTLQNKWFKYDVKKKRYKSIRNAKELIFSNDDYKRIFIDAGTFYSPNWRVIKNALNGLAFQPTALAEDRI